MRFNVIISDGVTNVIVKINRNTIDVGSSIKFKCEVECANPRVYTYRWIVNTTDATNDAFPHNETLDYTCTSQQSLNIQCCASNGIGDEKCGSTVLTCGNLLLFYIRIIIILSSLFRLFSYNNKYFKN